MLSNPYSDVEKLKMICPKCNGTGWIIAPTTHVNIICPKCLGKKKLDWIENIVGVKYNHSTWQDISENQIEGTICESK